MTRLSNIKSKASNIKESVSDTLSRDEDNLGPDRGTQDQLQARKERARMEGKREAQREQRQQEIEEAREKAKEAAQKPDGVIGRAAAAVSSVADEIDLDGDGEVLADELIDPARDAGGQPQQPSSSGVPAAIEEDLAALKGEVSENDTEIDRLEDEVFGDGRAQGGQDPLGKGFDAGQQLGYDEGGEK